MLHIYGLENLGCIEKAPLNCTMNLKKVPHTIFSYCRQGKAQGCICIYSHTCTCLRDAHARSVLFVNIKHVDELLLTSVHNTPGATEKTQ